MVICGGPQGVSSDQMVLPAGQKGTITPALQQLVKLTSYLSTSLLDCYVTRVAATLQTLYDQRSRATEDAMKEREKEKGEEEDI